MGNRATDWEALKPTTNSGSKSCGACGKNMNLLWEISGSRVKEKSAEVIVFWKRALNNKRGLTKREGLNHRVKAENCKFVNVNEQPKNNGQTNRTVQQNNRYNLEGGKTTGECMS